MDSPGPELAFALIAMEGPDQYSQAGGLGVRITQLGRALAAAGLPARTYFVGDPQLPAREQRQGLELVRVGREISAQFPSGVYSGEQLKLSYLAARLPARLLEEWVQPQLEAGRLPVLMFEEWQTAAWATGTARLLRSRGLGQRCLVLWNANNQFGFEGMDWVGLDRVAAITTISRHMRLLVEGYGVAPIVIPNGVQPELLVAVDPEAVARLRAAAEPRQLLLKVGRFHPDKRWLQAVRGLGELRSRGRPLRLLVRGSSDAYGDEVRAAARECGLRVQLWEQPVQDLGDLARALEQTPEADFLELTRFLPEELLPPLYAASLAVLANSGFEPFGLVGLEAMAAGGLPVVGATGEDYARHLHNSLVMETEYASELATAVSALEASPGRAQAMRQAARATAASYSWPLVVEGDLLPRLPLLARRQGWPWPESRSA